MTLDLGPVKAREAAATPGPWGDLWFGTAKYGCRADVPWPRRPPSGLWRRGMSVTAEDDVSVSYTESAPFTDADADFIAHARADVPALVAEVERLRAELAARADDRPVACLCGDPDCWDGRS